MLCWCPQNLEYIYPQHELDIVGHVIWRRALSWEGGWKDLRGIQRRIKLHGMPICNSKIIKYFENREDIFKESEVFIWMYQIQVSSYSFLFWIICTWERQQKTGLLRSIHFPSVSTGLAKPLFHHCCKCVISSVIAGIIVLFDFLRISGSCFFQFLIDF